MATNAKATDKLCHHGIALVGDEEASFFPLLSFKSVPYLKYNKLACSMYMVCGYVRYIMLPYV